MPSPPHATDAELALRCARGDESAWRTLVDRHQRLVYAVCRGAGLDADQADDVFMDCFSRLLRHLPELEEPGRVRAWLLTTARRLSIDFLRRSRRQDPLDTTPTRLVDPGEIASESLERLERCDLVHRAVQRLDDRCRELLRLLYLGEEPVAYEAVAQRLRMPLGSIGPTRARCLEKLRILYLELSEDPQASRTSGGRP